MKKYPFTYMRGGTSRAVFFHKKDLPADEALWPAIFLKAIGAEDPEDKFFSVMGTNLPTKKVAVISPSEHEGADVDYLFFQAGPDYAAVDSRGTCGNMSSAVGPFAIDEGLVAAAEPETVVRIYNKNTNCMITAHVQVKDGKALVKGDTRLPGWPGSGSPIMLHFENPGGGFSGRLFPTGNKIDILSLPGHGECPVTIIDCANPVTIIRASDLGLAGNEINELNAMKTTLDKIETARCVSAERLNLVSHWEDAKKTSTYIPHVVIVSPPDTYETAGGCMVNAADMDLCCRAVFTALHKSYPIAAAIATAASARIAGSVAYDYFKSPDKNTVRIGHPGGIIRVGIETDGGRVIRGSVLRTARRIFDGYLYDEQE